MHSWARQEDRPLVNGKLTPTTALRNFSWSEIALLSTLEVKAEVRSWCRIPYGGEEYSPDRIVERDPKQLPSQPVILPCFCDENTNWPPLIDAGCIWRSGDMMITDSVIPPLRLAPHITPQSLLSVTALPESECYTVCNSTVSRFVRSRRFSTSPVNPASYHRIPLSCKVFPNF